MNKELNIIEAIEMPVGAKFNVIFNDGCEAKVILEKTNTGNGKYFKWIKPPKNAFDGETRDSVIAASRFINAKFIPRPNPVTFIEAIKASQEGKTIYVNVEDRTYTYYPNPRDKKFDELRAKETRGGLSTYEILNGKWYIKD